MLCSVMGNIINECQWMKNVAIFLSLSPESGDIVLQSFVTANNNIRITLNLNFKCVNFFNAEGILILSIKDFERLKL